VEAVAELRSASSVSFLAAGGRSSGLAGLAHAVALDGLGEDDGRLADVLDRRACRRRRPCADRGRRASGAQISSSLMSATISPRSSGYLPEEVLAHVRAVVGLEGLVFAVDAFHPST
jgi:hypothetical protein